MRTRTRLAVVVAAILLAAGGAVVWLWRAETNRQARRAFRAAYHARLVGAIRGYYLAERALPTDWEALVASGAYAISPDELNAMIHLGLNVSKGPNPVADFQRESFRAARSSSSRRLGDWIEQIHAAEKPLRDLEGDLGAQLDLFLDPQFDASVGVPFLERLMRERGVCEAALIAFGKASSDMHFAYLLLERPEAALDHPDFIPITKARAQKELDEARAELRRLKAEILRQAGELPDAERPPDESVN